MNEFKGMGWFKMNNKWILLISDECNQIPRIMHRCHYIICSTKIARKYKEKFDGSGATIISF